VAAGERLGDVGHSGLNASQAGHGRHLHFETNEYSDGQVRALSYQRLRAMLRGWRSSSSPVDRCRSLAIEVPQPAAPAIAVHAFSSNDKRSGEMHIEILHPAPSRFRVLETNGQKP
jgi:hypothetical protein